MRFNEIIQSNAYIPVAINGGYFDPPNTAPSFQEYIPDDPAREAQHLRYLQISSKEYIAKEISEKHFYSSQHLVDYCAQELGWFENSFEANRFGNELYDCRGEEYHGFLYEGRNVEFVLYPARHRVDGWPAIILAAKTSNLTWSPTLGIKLKSAEAAKTHVGLVYHLIGIPALETCGYNYYSIKDETISILKFFVNNYSTSHGF